MDSKEITVKENNNTVAEVINFKEKALEYLQSMGNKLPVKQQTQFIEMAQGFGLNPFKREIYAVGYGDNWNIITGYEVYLKRAERIGKLDGWEATVDGSGENMTATVTIYRKDWSHPFKHTVLFSEVCQKTKDGKLNSVWGKMPTFMCRKVAIAQAFRLCFPDEFSGMPYTSDEMPAEEDMKNITPSTSELVKEATTESKPAKKKAEKLYTPEQAAELGAIMNTLDHDGKTLFTDAEKNTFREMLMSGKFEHAKEEAERLLKDRTAIDAEIVKVTEGETDTPLF
ncbi:MAG: recombinase RecT [Lachnospiraceae bacterium]|nr:recombinase RecT [Lachnospiraceae bacterium]